MSTDFRDGKTFPRRGRDPLGGYLWLARIIDKARAIANGTQDGYIYPCPMDRAMLRHWGVDPRAFTAAIAENATDEQILGWLSQRVTADRMRIANEWLQRQKWALDRHDAEEGVPGAVAPTSPPPEIIRGIVAGAVVLIAAWLSRYLHH